MARKQKRKTRKLDDNLVADMAAGFISDLERVLNGEADKPVWVKPWNESVIACNAVTGRPYNGANIFLTAIACQAGGFTVNRWLTKNQVIQQSRKDGIFRDVKGIKPLTIVHYGPIIKKGDDGTEKICGWRETLWDVINVEQVTPALPGSFLGVKADGEGPSEEDRIFEADMFLRGLKANVRHVGDVACYSPITDTITMPPKPSFNTLGDYYSTLIHEHVHWTGHESRLDRLKRERFGTPGYAREELVAEMGSAVLCNMLGIDGNFQHFEYIYSWIARLKNDPKELLTASKDVNKAIKFMEKQQED